MRHHMQHLAQAKTPIAPIIIPIGELRAYSIEQFCALYGISRGSFYNMKANGTGPKDKRAMGRVLITREAAQEWSAGL